MVEKITQTEYTGLQNAFDYFNKHLFDSKLPECLITFQNHPLAFGFYRPKHFKGRTDSKVYTDEIALNPEEFSGRSNEQILSTLVHEMVHLWQQHFGKPSRMGYHNKEWAHKMLEIGLKPVSNEDPTKIIGQSMGHEIMQGGRFQMTTQSLLKKHSLLNWESVSWLNLLIGIGGDGDNSNVSDEPVIKPRHRPKKRDRSKVKFTCSDCGQNAWAKETACLVCGLCSIEMVENE